MKFIKNLLFNFLLLLIVHTSYAQNMVSVSLTVDNSPTPVISEWQDRAELATYTVTAHGSFIGQQAKIIATLKKDGEIIAQTRYADAPFFTMDGTTQIFTAQDFLNTGTLDINISDADKTTALTTGMLPGGVYTLCVQLYDENGQQIFTTPLDVCAIMVITSYQMPELIFPENQAQVTLQQLPALRFYWSGITPYPTYQGVKYLFRVSEVLFDPLDDISSASPLVEETITDTQYFLPPNVDYNEMLGKTYCWSVKPLMNDDTPYINDNYGFVPVHTFTVVDPTANPGQQTDVAGDDNQDEDDNQNEQGTKPVFNIEDASGYEGESIVFTISLDQPAPQDIEFEITPVNETADDNDYTAQAVNITIPAQAESADIEIPLVLDDATEGEETFKLQVTATGDATANQSITVTGTIYDANEQLPELSIDDVVATEGDKLYFVITTGKVSPTDIVLNVSIEDISTTPADYAQIGNGNNTATLTIPAGEQATALMVQTIPDDDNENEEKFRLKAVVTSNNTLNKNLSAEGTIIDLSDSKKIYVAGNGSNNLDDYFMIVITGNPTITNGKITGKGYVHIPWLNADLAVEFNDIEVDGSRKLVDGVIYAQINKSAPNINTLKALASGTANWANDYILAVQDFINSHFDSKLHYKTSSLATQVKLPFGIQFDKDLLVVPVVSFEPQTAKMTLVAGKELPESWNTAESRLGFIAQDVAFNKTDIVDFNNLTLTLLDNFTITSGTGADQRHFTFNRGNAGATNPGCFISLKDGDIDQYGLDISAELPRSWMYPVGHENDNQKTQIHLTGNVDSWDDMILTGDLPASELPGTAGMKIEASNLVLDMSPTMNADNMQFPDGYANTGVTDNTFQGFYGKNISLTLPKAWRTKTGLIDLNIHNLIMNNQGVSLAAEVHPAMTFNGSQVELVGLAASLEEVKFSILNNALNEASITGSLVLPLTNPDDNENFALDYEAVLQIANQATQVDETNFAVTITPGQIKADLFGDATINTTDGTYMKAYVSNTKHSFDINVNGEFVMDTKINDKIPFELGASVEGLKMNYNINNDEKFDMDAGTWAFNISDGCKLVFPASMDGNNSGGNQGSGQQAVHETGISFDKKTHPQDGRIFEGKLNVNLALNLSKDISGYTSVGFDVGINDDYKPELLGVVVNTVSVDAKTSVVDIKGEMNYTENEYGNGVSAELDVKMKAAGNFGARALVEFGKSQYQSNDWYRYWHVELDLNAKVPFISPLQFYQFGGGAFRHMESVYNEQAHKYVYTPNKDVNLGLIARVGIETNGNTETFNALPELRAVIKNEALQYVSLGGNFAVGGRVEEINGNDKPFLFGNLQATYHNQPAKYFDLVASVEIPEGDAHIISTPKPADFSFYIDDTDVRMLFGTPGEMNKVKILGAEVRQYLMFGSGIPASRTQWDDKFADAYEFNTGKQISTGIPNQSQTVNGFAYGSNFGFLANGGTMIVDDFGVAYNINALAQLDASLMDGYDCNGSASNTGLNGWRAEGLIGFTAGVDLKAGIGQGDDKLDYIANNGVHLMHVGVGANVQGGFPNPTYARGSIDGKVEILGCDIDFSASFETGKQCKRDANADAIDITQIYLISSTKVSDFTDQVYPFDYIPVSYNMPVNQTMPLLIRVGESSNQVNQVNLKLLSDVKLYKKNGNNWETLPFSEEAVDDKNIRYDFTDEPSSQYKFVIDARLVNVDDNSATLKSEHHEYVFYSIKYPSLDEIVNNVNLDPWRNPLMNDELLSVHNIDVSSAGEAPLAKKVFVNIKNAKLYKNGQVSNINIDEVALLRQKGIRDLNITPEPQPGEHYYLVYEVEAGEAKPNMIKTPAEIQAMSDNVFVNYINNRIKPGANLLTRQVTVQIGDIAGLKQTEQYLSDLAGDLSDMQGVNDVQDVINNGGIVFPGSGGPNVVVGGDSPLPGNLNAGNSNLGTGSMSSQFLTSSNYNNADVNIIIP